MAKQSKYAQKKIQDTEGGNFGGYTEDTGGGHPFNAGDSNTRTTKKNGQYRKDNNDTMQPRTDDGKFTYKSVNGKSIDPQYGPSRGKTVNPLLTGGKNGVKIEDVEKQFAEEKGDIWDEYKDKWYREGGEAIVNGLKVKVAGQAIWDTAKEYDMVKGEFKGYHEGKKEYVQESDTWNETKKGRRSMAMKTALQKAKKMKESQFVVNQKSGGIQGGQAALSKKVQAQAAAAKQAPYKKKQPGTSAGQGTIPQSPRQGTIPQASPNAGQGTSAPQNAGLSMNQSKFTPDVLQEATQILNQNGIDTSSLTVRELDDLIEKTFVIEE